MAGAHVSRRSWPPIWFYGVAALGMVFNLFGLISFVSLQTQGVPASMTSEQAAYFESFPAWYTVLYAVTVHASVAAAGLLLFRKRLAVTFFVIALVVYAISSIWHFGFRNAFEILGAGNLAFTAL
ncbi:MAG: hypothetical protein ACOC05_10865, partial [Oceanicaulis sp.]